MIARGLCIFVALALAGIECWGVYDFLHGQQGRLDYAVALGVVVAAVAPALPWAAVFSWRIGLWPLSFLAVLVFPAAVALVLLSGANRMGSAADAVDASVARANREYALAREAKARASDALDAATRAMREECAGKGEKGAKCKAERANVEAAQSRYDTAIATLRDAPTEQSNALAHRVAKLLPVSEEQVTLYVPMLWPLVAFIVGTVFLSAGLHAPRKELPRLNAPAPSLQVAHTAPPAPARPKVVHIRAGKVSKFVLDRLRPAPGSRVEAGAALLAYREWCKEKGHEPLPVADFANELGLICKKVGVKTVEAPDGVYCLDVQIAS